MSVDYDEDFNEQHLAAFIRADTCRSWQHVHDIAVIRARLPASTSRETS